MARRGGSNSTKGPANPTIPAAVDGSASAYHAVAGRERKRHCGALHIFTMMLGSTSTALLHAVDIPMIIVRAPRPD
ncbi:hypothetical protein [Nocardia speluncae]|uniref:hypothetical protein n=1 Tax=Nocardia speluncae TaxID=419477 RepID=UPI000A975841|nr:hypothetical protein [Nocardia speluncae]